MDADQIKQISIENKEYPKLLKDIKNAPKILYYKGILPKPEEICLAVVGTRNPSAYGQQVALQISSELAKQNIIVVSGLAPGIDTFAHRAVIENKKRAIAVLGTGLDEKSIYPQSNLALSKKIIEFGGCLISELPPGTCGSKFSFPRRNRIISGLSLGVIIIEAKEKSGSLITANCSIEQNRKLFAVPGPIYSLNSTGPNKLIKNGAKLVENSNDILKELGLQLCPIEQNKPYAENPEEKIIFEALKDGPLHIDKIIEKTGLMANEAAARLALMEVSDKIRNLGANIYSII
jgi:DNA processing protein